MKKERPAFDINKCCYANNPVYLAKIFDPYTAKMARFLYNRGISAHMVLFANVILGIASLFVLFFMRSYKGLVIAAILIFLKNLCDTIDGKIARGSGTSDLGVGTGAGMGGFTDIVADWLFFHAGFFIVIGYITGHIVIGFLCVTGYMSREFARRKFEQKYKLNVKETEEAKKMPFLVSIVKKYDLAGVTILTPILLLIINPVYIIYFVAIVEYSLLFAELAFDYYCFYRKNEKEKESLKK